MHRLKALVFIAQAFEFGLQLFPVQAVGGGAFNIIPVLTKTAVEMFWLMPSPAADFGKAVALFYCQAYSVILELFGERLFGSLRVHRPPRFLVIRS